MPEVKEWAIRDDETGVWWTNLYQPRWHPTVWDVLSYREATVILAGTHEHYGARIVPAPVRELTDAECWQWMKTQPTLRIGWSCLGKNAYVAYGLPNTEDAVGDTPCDAIRAARRALESK